MAAGAMIVASSRTQIQSTPNPKPKRPSLIIPKFPLFPVAKPPEFPSLSAKSLAMASFSLAVSKPLPALAAGIRMTPRSRFFDLTIPIIVAGFLYLLLEFRKYLDSPEFKLLVEEVEKEQDELKEKVNAKKKELRAIDTEAEAESKMREKIQTDRWSERRTALAAEWNQKVEEWKMMKREAAAAWNQMKALTVGEVEALTAEGRKAEAEIEAAKEEMKAARAKLEAQKKRVGEVEEMVVFNAMARARKQAEKLMDASTGQPDKDGGGSRGESNESGGHGSGSGSFSY